MVTAGLKDPCPLLRYVIASQSWITAVELFHKFIELDVCNRNRGTDAFTLATTCVTAGTFENYRLVKGGTSASMAHSASEASVRLI